MILLNFSEKLALERKIENGIPTYFIIPIVENLQAKL
jgi:hypothetical protein